MANVHEYNGKLFCQMSDEEMLGNYLDSLLHRSTSEITSSIAAAIIRRMSARSNHGDNIYVCDECGTTFCFECNKIDGAVQGSKIEPRFCCENCKDAYENAPGVADPR